MMKLKPSEIRYSQDSISCTFTGEHSGKKIGKTLDKLVNGKIRVDNIPKISVIFRNGKWFTCDNRRLWVFKHFELLGGSTHISATERTCMNMSKFTTDNEGTAIRVRGSPGGTWYDKYSQHPTKYRNHLRNRNFNPYTDPPTLPASSCVEYFRSELSTSSYQSSVPMQSTNDWRYNTERSSISYNTDTSPALFGSQQQPITRYQSTSYPTDMVSKSTFISTNAVINSSQSLFSHEQKRQQNASRLTEAQKPTSESNIDYTSISGMHLVPVNAIAAQPVHKSTPSTFTTCLTSSQNVFGRTQIPVPTSEATSAPFVHQTYQLSTPESSLRNSRQALLGSNSSVTRHLLAPNESGFSLINQRNSEHMTSSSENEPASKKRKYSNVTEPVQDHDINKTADINRPSIGSSMPAMRTASIKGPALKSVPKLKPALSQRFATSITVKQSQCHPQEPVLIMLDISKIRYTKDAIKYPFSDERQSEVQIRLRDLLKATNPKPLEVYKAYDLYWFKEENDVLWSLLKFVQDCSVWGKTIHTVKALVTEDNDAFLEFIRKDKPWLQICEILQLGQTIKVIK